MIVSMIKTKSEPTLDILFDSQDRARILKLFLYNPDQNFELRFISKKLNIKSSALNKQLKNLDHIKFLNSKKIQDKKTFKVNRDFIFYNELKGLVYKSSPASRSKILERLKNLGKIKLAVLAGIFVNADNSQADLLIVGDDVKLPKFNKFLSDLEAEIGKELNYVLMTTKEFYYRHDMYDRFIRDLLEFKHEKLINKLKI